MKFQLPIFLKSRRCIKYIYGILLSFYCTGLTAQQLKLGNNVTRFDSTAALEIESQKQTLLLPRIADTSTLVKPMKDGALIYFENLAAAGNNKGLYLRGNNRWNWIAPAGVASNIDWSVTGNSGNGAGSFLGTTDNRPLVFRTNNITRFFIDSTTGYVGFRTTAPAAGIHNHGSTLLGIKSITSLPGNGAIGTALNTVDSFTAVSIAPAMAGSFFSIPAPTNTQAGRIVIVLNAGSNYAYIGDARINGASAMWFTWNGAAWTPLLDGWGANSFPAPAKDGFGIMRNALSLTTSGFNIAIGVDALKSVYSGTNNVGIGNRAGKGIAGQANNFAIGHDAMTAAPASSTASQIAIGDSALAISSGDYCIAIGNRALASNTTGFSNTALGADALRSVTTGAHNSAVGYQALANSGGSSSYNTAMGYRAAYNLVSGDKNTAIGAYALSGVVSGSLNTAIGYCAGNTDSITPSATNISNATAIGAFAQITQSNTIILGSANPAYATNVGIGIYSPTYKLQVNGTMAGTGTSYTTSDGRLKQNIRPVTNALRMISSLRAVTFKWDPGTLRKVHMNNDKRAHLGFIAQELEQVLPELVSTAKDSMHTKSVSYNTVVPVLTEAVKERQKIIERLKENNALLRRQLELLEEQEKQLEQAIASGNRK